MRGKRVVALVLLCVAIMLSTGVDYEVYGDMGPKPSLKLFVQGMESGDYWLDLLVTDSPDFSKLEIDGDERLLVKKLAEYVDDQGYHPALLKGTWVPLHGELKGVKQPNGSYLHSFSYVGVPDKFKIAILKADGQLIVSSEIKRKQFQSVMYYDLDKLEVTESGVDKVDYIDAKSHVQEKLPWGMMSLNFMIRLALTIIIELLIALVFTIKSKENIKLIFLTNIATQCILNIIILSSFLKLGMIDSMITFILAELIVIGVELTIYTRKIIDKSKLLVVIYTIVANIVTIVTGLFLYGLS